MATKYGLSEKGIKGRAPDRTIVYDHPNGKKFSIFVVEAKTSKSSKENPDLVKLATVMKDILDFAITKGVSSHHAVGLLVEGPSCKLYKLNMPINRLYCLQEISCFSVPDNMSDNSLQLKIEQLIISMIQCQQLVDYAIINLQNDQNSTVPAVDQIVDSCPSPAYHFSFYKKLAHIMVFTCTLFFFLRYDL